MDHSRITRQRSPARRIPAAHAHVYDVRVVGCGGGETPRDAERRQELTSHGG